MHIDECVAHPMLKEVSRSLRHARRDYSRARVHTSIWRAADREAFHGGSNSRDGFIISSSIMTRARSTLPASSPFSARHDPLDSRPSWHPCSLSRLRQHVMQCTDTGAGPFTY